MKKLYFLLLFIMVLPSAVSAKNSFCNFTLELGEGIVMGETYEMRTIEFENLDFKYQKKAMGKLDLTGLYNSKISLEHFQEHLGSICQVKKFEIFKVLVSSEKGGFKMSLFYQPIAKSSKSKG